MQLDRCHHGGSSQCLYLRTVDCDVHKQVESQDIPEAILTVQVREVELVAGKLSRAALLGEAPGRILFRIQINDGLEDCSGQTLTSVGR